MVIDLFGSASGYVVVVRFLCVCCVFTSVPILSVVELVNSKKGLQSFMAGYRHSRDHIQGGGTVSRNKYLKHAVYRNRPYILLSSP